MLQILSNKILKKKLNPEEYHRILNEMFLKNRDKVVAEGMKKYMRNQFDFYGIKRPPRNDIQRSFLQQHGLPQADQLIPIITLMWENPYREMQLAALDIMRKMIKKTGPDFVNFLEKLIQWKSWWDTVDLIASNLIGTSLKRFPEFRQQYPIKWIKSDNFWLQRTAILYQLKYKQETNQEDLFDFINRVKDSNEFFLQKGSGWALREYSKTNASAVVQFINETELAPLTKREGLKWLKTQGRL